MFYSGIDLHKYMSFITTIHENGIIVKQNKLPNDEYSILNHFFSIGIQHRAVVESTANWYWLSDLLNDHVIELILAHAKYLKMAFTEASIRAIQCFKEIKAFFQSKDEKHKNIAKTLVAQELA